MLLNAIIIFILLFSTAYTLLYSKEKAFLNIYLPLLFLTPDNLHLEIPGIPHISLNQVAILPIFGVFLLNKGARKIGTRNDYGFLSPLASIYHYGFVGLLVCGYIFVSIYSEYLNTGIDSGSYESLWEHQLVFMLLSVWMPFVIGKSMIFQKNLFVPFAKRIVILMMINLFLFPFEWRLTTGLITRFFMLIAPDQVQPGLSLRFGSLRLTGPFMHPILTGLIFAVAFLLNSWLTRNKLWKRNGSWLLPIYFSKGTYISVGLLLGLLATFSRGPLYPMILAYILIGIGYVRKKWFHLFLRLGVIFALAAIYLSFNEIYFEPVYSKNNASELTGTALYRIGLITTYAPYIDEKPWWGWGVINTLGKKTGMASIDNHYLNILVTHGYFALVFFSLICLTVLFCLFKRGMSGSKGDVMQNSLSFTLFGVYLTMVLAFATVYMGGQTEPLFFLFTGISIGLLQFKKIEIVPPQKKSLTLAPA